jgi:uncharacterized membrane protein YfcA
VDIINSLFEFFASLFILNNCYTLYKDKQVKGVSILSTAFFTSWGLWNVFYYPHLGQQFSFYAGIAVLLANILWVGMMVYYSRKCE